jgi:hypothetical protein
MMSELDDIRVQLLRIPDVLDELTMASDTSESFNTSQYILLIFSYIPT